MAEAEKRIENSTQDVCRGEEREGERGEADAALKLSKQFCDNLT